MRKKIYYPLIAIATVLMIVFFAFVFSGTWVLPQELNLGFLQLHYYGLIIALAAMVGLSISLSRTKSFGMERASAENLLFWIIIFGFLGARAWHVLSEYNYYSHHTLQIFFVWNGGLAIYGAIFGGILGILLYQKLSTKSYSLLTFLDWLTPGLIAGQAIGRLGNLFNYELYGYPTTLPWKMFVPEIFRSADFMGYNYFHPLFLYESLGLLLILCLIRYLAKNPYFKAPGRLFFSYFLLYNIVRFFVEALRIDTVLIGGFRLNFIFSFTFIILSLLIIIFKDETKHA